MATRTESREVARHEVGARHQTAGSGSASDPYRWGRIVACRFCRSKGLSAPHIVEEAESVANLAVAAAMPNWDAANGSLTGFVAMVVERRLKHWLRKESKWATRRLPLAWEWDEQLEPTAPIVDFDVSLVAAEIRNRLGEMQNRSDAELIAAFVFSNEDRQDVARQCQVSRQHLWEVLRRNRPQLIAILGRQ